jgi:hypothetical protein
MNNQAQGTAANRATDPHQHYYAVVATPTTMSSGGIQPVRVMVIMACNCGDVRSESVEVT